MYRYECTILVVIVCAHKMYNTVKLHFTRLFFIRLFYGFYHLLTPINQYFKTYKGLFIQFENFLGVENGFLKGWLVMISQYKCCINY